jgi:hypothetical protein
MRVEALITPLYGDDNPAAVSALRDINSLRFGGGTLWDSVGSQTESQASPLFPDPDQIAITVVGDELRIVSLTQESTYTFVDSFDHLHRILYINSLEVLAYREAVAELEYLVNGGTAAESSFQRFFERFPRLLTGNDYVNAHPHVVLAAEDSVLIPDFMLEPAGSTELCDLLELKLPTARITTSRGGHTRFSAKVLEAAQQLQTYKDYFESAANRTRVANHYGISAFRPQMIVVIGRRGTTDPLELRRAETLMPNLRLRTYDDLIARARVGYHRPSIGSR